MLLSRAMSRYRLQFSPLYRLLMLRLCIVLNDHTSELFRGRIERRFIDYEVMLQTAKMAFFMNTF